MKLTKCLLLLLTIGLILFPSCSDLGLSCGTSAEPTPVPAGPCSAQFTASVTECAGRCWIDFTSQSPGKIKEWYWDFDDDGITDATGPVARNYYNDNGFYSVTLTIVGPDCSDSLTKTDYIHIYGCSG